jgi:hypothetical protein
MLEVAVEQEFPGLRVFLTWLRPPGDLLRCAVLKLGRVGKTWFISRRIFNAAAGCSLHPSGEWDLGVPFIFLAYQKGIWTLKNLKRSLRLTAAFRCRTDTVIR